MVQLKHLYVIEDPNLNEILFYRGLYDVDGSAIPLRVCYQHLPTTVEYKFAFLRKSKVSQEYPGIGCKLPYSRRNVFKLYLTTEEYEELYDVRNKDADPPSKPSVDVKFKDFK